MLKYLCLLLLALLGESLLAFGFTNPIKSRNGSDPFMVYHEGYYYLTSTTWSNIQITRATTIAGLKTASPKVIWTDGTSSRCCNMWAPEIHCYYSAGTSGTFDNQRIHVLKGSSNTIWDSSWSYAGRITIPNRDVWSIDATVLVLGSTRYLVYSSWEGAYQCLYIAQMTSATSVGNAVKISTPTLSWEQVGANVNEGPAAIYHGGRTWIVFSASNCAGTGYKLGRLELTGLNPLSASSWTKYGNPIFTSANGNYEPGHNGFFLSPSSNQIWNVYHASATSPGNCDGSRYTLVQPVSWNSDGTPNLGSPLPLSSNIAEPV
ncbi:glycoside hydrolase family 43 protein [Amanita thiersii Skay4041]|uniref:Glycoside hydrolase family 43 protein n=1 Tax=Amanita thiersii Skay4041 TaxID=703135 RepID=A0A2A9NRE0_9AGAR|nr:glycoside hydrolase family 43 protein [Amanita thiersii Skay4041]